MIALRPAGGGRWLSCEVLASSGPCVIDAIRATAAATGHMETAMQTRAWQRVWWPAQQNYRRLHSPPFGMLRTERRHSAAGKPMPQGHWV
jgi:hypothetical protein